MADRVVITTSSFGDVSPEPLDRLRHAGFEPVVNPLGRALSAAEVVPMVAGAVGLIAGTEPLPRATLSALVPTLRVISRVGVGVDKIDLTAARELGIEVRNTPSAHVDSVAELTLGGILAMSRAMPAADRAIRGGAWKKPMGRLLRGKVVGFVGYGQVARALHALMRPFGVIALAADPVLQDGGDARVVTLDKLFAEADVISVHLPGGEATRGLINASLLERMRPDALFVNTARGDVVDEPALVDWLGAHPSGAAYLDVFQKEPYSGPLVSLPNVLMTPHIGSYAREARVQMEVEAVTNLLQVLS
jgi:D-3-phosphoglycerate dehydrogenase